MSLKLLVLTTPDHMYANQIVTHLIQTRSVCEVWESGVLLHRQSTRAALARYWRVSGLLYVAGQGAKQTAYKIATRISRRLNFGNPGDALFSYGRLATARGIPVSRVLDVNNAQSRRRIEQLAPDLLVSVYFNQLIAPDTLRLATHGGINGHPARLPAYRGVSPVFWCLARGEAQAGFTVHTIDAGIDSGTLLAQVSLPVLPHDTEHSLYWRLTTAGVALFDQVLDAIEQGRQLAVPAQAPDSYYSLPTRSAFHAFRARGKRLFRVRELWALFTTRRRGDDGVQHIA